MANGFIGKISEYADDLRNHPRLSAAYLKINRLEREKIVKALGGEEICKAIPVVEFHPLFCTPSLILDDQYFAQGESVVQGQGEDGRTFVILRLRETADFSTAGPFPLDRPFIVTVHQQYRETDVNGNKWSLRSRKYAYRDLFTTDIVQFIAEARSGRGKYAFSPKP